MNTEIEHLHKAYRFLVEKHREDRAFSKEDFRRAVGSDVVFQSYWSPHFAQLLARVDDVGQERFLVASAFSYCVDVNEFERRILRIREEDVDYSVATHLRMINYEFFLPLAHENNLELTLHSLFFKDAILKRLHSVGLVEVQRHFAKQEGELDDAYLERVCGWIGEKFGGYSVIKNVDGCFRMGGLKTAHEAAELMPGRYLAKETTAVVRFIFKCGKPAARNFHAYDDYSEMPLAKDDQETKQDAYLIRYFFWKLFVESIIKCVNGEAEIWLVEKGMRSRLHIWSKTAGQGVATRTQFTGTTDLEQEPWYGWVLRALGMSGCPVTENESKAP
jgi:hypothetical protein